MNIDNNIYSVKVQFDKLGKMFKMFVNKEIDEETLWKQTDYIRGEINHLYLSMQLKIDKIKGGK